MEFLNTLLAYFDGLEYVGYLLAFFFAASESTIGMSMLVPGSLIVMGLGALSALGSFKIYYLLPIAILGAVVGDNISYFLGKRFGRKLLKKTRFIQQDTILLAEDFIKKHGAKSVLLGRFVPIVKETIPFVAGTLKMDRKKFFVFNVLGAIGWGFMWPGTGYLFARAVLAGEAWLSWFQAAIVAFIVVYLFYFFSKDFLLVKFESKIQNKFINTPNSRLVFKYTLISAFIYASFVFLAIAVLEQKAFVQTLDFLGFKWIFDYFNVWLLIFFFVITYTAKWFIVVLWLILLSVFFIKKKLYEAVVPLWASAFFAAASVHFLKHFIARPRPEIARAIEGGYAFPSGHAALTTTLAGILIFLTIKYRSKGRRFWIIASLTVWAILIYASRIYLGVHYMSDIWGGILVGLLAVLFGAAFWYYLSYKPLNLKSASTKQITKTVNKNTNSRMQILSSAFEHFSKIPSKYTCDGENINPELIFKAVSENAKSLALIMDDPDVPVAVRSDRHFTHWVVYNIAPSTVKLQENENSFTSGVNDAGELSYFGPCPPSNFEPSEHRYFFKLYALDLEPNLRAGLT